jgi:hypothetical protein
MDYTLSVGGHADPQHGRCAMEWIAFLCGEPHSARPKGVSDYMRHIMIYLNDQLGDQQRQRLRPYLTRCIGTVDDGHEEMRRARWSTMEHELSQVRHAYENILGDAPEAGWLDPFAEAFFAPGGFLDQMLPLERIPMPEPPPKPANSLDAFDQAMKSTYQSVFKGYWPETSAILPPPVLIDWKKTEVIQPKPGYLAEIAKAGSTIAVLQELDEATV